MSVLYLSDRFECVGNRFKNPDLIRFFNNFYRFCYQSKSGIGKTRSQNEGEFFSQKYLDFLSDTLGEEEILRDFLTWLREELLTYEHTRRKLFSIYTPRQFVEILFLLFNNQKKLELGPEQSCIKDIFAGKVCDVLNEIHNALSQDGFDVLERLELTINKGFFPISSQGELLIFVSDVETGKAEFLTFPSFSKIIANIRGEILEVKYESSDNNLDDEDGTQIDFLDWFFTDTEPSDMTVEELRTRLAIYEKWMKFHRGEGQILSKNEYKAYIEKLNLFADEQFNVNSFDELPLEEKKYLNEQFNLYINGFIKKIRGALRNKILINVIK